MGCRYPLADSPRAHYSKARHSRARPCNVDRDDYLKLVHVGEHPIWLR